MKERTIDIDPRWLLRRELERRCRANPRYSLRAFARAVGISPTGLSLMLSGSRPVSRKAASKIARQLALSPEESTALLEWARLTPRMRRSALSDARDGDPAGEETYRISLDAYALISDWFHTAILNLADLAGVSLEARWIARKLGITEIEARNAVERLQRMRMIDRVNGRWKRLVRSIRVGDDIPASALKKRLAQLLAKAVESLENEPEENADFSSMTFSMDPARIPYAKEQITRFRRKLARELELGGKTKRIYSLTVQLFPVSKPLKE